MCLFQNYLNLPDSKQNLHTFGKSASCSAVILMGMQIDGGQVKRDLGLINVGEDQRLYDGLCDALMQNQKLELQEIHGIDFPNGRFFEQINVKASRKQILPIAKSVLDNFE